MLTWNRRCRVRIISADVLSVLSELALAGIELYQVETIDYVTVEVSIDAGALKTVKHVLAHLGSSFKIIERQKSIIETYWLVRRVVLTVGLILFFLSAMVIPNRILFVDVIGNRDISSQEILMQAENIGIKFFARAKDVRSEECKNKLLESIPQLQWLGITIKGCIATIQVQERSIYPETNPETRVVSNIIAICDGVLTDQTVYRGNPLFHVGDAVKKGDILISGYVDCGLKLSATQAKAEIYALTMREYQFLCLKPSALRGEIQSVHTCYQLRIGKKVINFCNHSGIMDATCVKMYVEDYWTFPGGFQLPVALVKISYWDHEIIPESPQIAEKQWVSQFARQYLYDHLVSARILDEQLQWQDTEQFSVLLGTYACHEMIGKEKCEEIIE